MLYFFLSYARGNEDDLVRRFFEDLSADIRLLVGLDPMEPVGFVDRTMLIGERWPQRLTDALTTCRSFLALVTPRYFLSEPCGKEWQLFADRNARFEQQHRVDSSLLKPVLWIPPRAGRLHPVVESIQYASGSLGEVYQRLGLRQMMRLQRYRDDYREFVYNLANQIVESVEAYPLPDDQAGPDFGAVRSAFHRVEPGSPPPRRPFAEAGAAASSLLVQFVIASAGREAMQAVREDLACYGDNALDWSPYRPPLPRPLAEYAREIAADHSFDAEVIDLDELARQIDLNGQAADLEPPAGADPPTPPTNQAGLVGRDDQIVVMLVDAWATRLEQTRQALLAHRKQVETGRQATTAVMIPGSRDDAETRRHWKELSRSCREIFDELVHDEELYRSNIVSHSRFREDLPDVLEVARNRVYASGRARRSAGNPTNTEAPRIDGPWTIDPEEELPRDDDEQQ